MIFVLIMIFMGPMMRMTFGGRGAGGRQDRLEGSARTELKRLESTLAERDLMLEDLQQRMSELVNELDSTERMLAERRDPLQVNDS